MNIFTIFFWQNCSKIYSKTHKIAPFLKKITGEHAPNGEQYPHFWKLDWTFPPKWNPKYAPVEIHLKCSREHNC